MPDRCIAEASHKLSHYGSSHTWRCQKDAGHEGAHEHRDESWKRHIIWFGEAKKKEDNTKWRYGIPVVS